MLLFFFKLKYTLNYVILKLIGGELRLAAAAAAAAVVAEGDVTVVHGGVVRVLAVGAGLLVGGALGQVEVRRLFIVGRLCGRVGGGGRCLVRVTYAATSICKIIEVRITFWCKFPRVGYHDHSFMIIRFHGKASSITMIQCVVLCVKEIEHGFSFIYFMFSKIQFNFFNPMYIRISSTFCEYCVYIAYICMLFFQFELCCRFKFTF
jgi:hypothetical protein